MRSVAKFFVVLLVLALAAGAVVSCGGGATPEPAPEPTAVPAAPAAPTSAPEPTVVPAVAPTSAPEPTAVPAVAPTAEPAESAAPEDGVERISMEELKALMESDARIAILDVRPKASYDLAHIEGAVSFPWKPQMSVADVEMLPPGNPVITYCDCGPGEHDSASVAAQLLELGAEVEIKVLADPSIEGWVEAGYPTEPPAEEPAAAPAAAPAESAEPEDGVERISMEELKALMESNARIAILDVRPKASYDLAHIKGAVSFPWKPQMSVADVEMLPPGNPVITYCDCGPGEHDSASVASQLLELGAEVEIKVLADPSIEGWVEAGYPTEP